MGSDLPHRPEFDGFARDYKSLLDQSVKISGESSEYFSEYKARYIARTVGAQFSGKVLDFGCGIGLLSAQLRQYLPAARLHGYDLSSESIRRIPPEIACECHFSSKLDDMDDDYELAIMANVIHHVVKEERAQTISEVAARLVPQGRLILFEHNPRNPATRWAAENCPFDEGAVLLPPREVLAYFARANLRVMKPEYIVFFPKVLSAFRWLEPWVSWLPAGAQYAVIGQKQSI